ncbi:MAG: adenylate/guanylate cyclase domain-containing protein [Chlorobiota bacterium]
MKIYTRFFLIILFFALLSSYSYAQKQGQEKLDSLYSELKTDVQDTNQVKILNNIATIYFSIDPDKGIEYAKKSEEMAEEIGWEKGIASSYVAQAMNYSWGKSDFKLGQELYEKAYDIYDNLPQTVEIKKSKASILGNIGFMYRNQSDYPKALDYYQKSLLIFEEINNKQGIAANLGNIGTIYDYQGDFDRALEYYNKAMDLKKELKDKNGEAALLANIGLVYYFKADYDKALNNFVLSREFYEEVGNLNGQASNLGNIGLIYQKKGDYSKALVNYKKAAGIYDNLGSKTNLANNLGNIGELFYSLSIDSILNNIDRQLNAGYLNKQNNIDSSKYYYKRAIDLLEETGELHTRSRFILGLSNVSQQHGNYKKALELYKEYKTLDDSVFTEETQSQIANLEAVRENMLKDKELVIKDLEITQSKNERIAVIGGAIAVAFVAVIIFRQRQRSEQLLLNILPVNIAKRLKKKERLIADNIESASVVFIDLVGFTAYSKDRQAKEVVQMLNDTFDKIDELIVKYGLEKIKTIGDGYMAAAGVPDYCDDHSVRATNFSLDVHIVLEKINKENNTNIRARVGIESGPLVAGVIGDMKFAYDLWGDTVNTAARMESTGTPDLVHISANTKAELDRHEHDFYFEELEPMEVKGKGVMLTYMVHRK